MASLAEAKRALKRWSAELTRRGAHSFAVGTVRRAGRDVPAILAYFERKPSGVPAELEVGRGAASIRVPLVVRVGKRPRPEIEIG